MIDKFLKMNILRKIVTIFSLLTALFLLIAQIYLLFHPVKVYEMVKSLIIINPELIELFNLDVAQLFDNIFAISYFIFGWLFVFIISGIMLFIQNNKVEDNITIYIFSILATIIFPISVPIGFFLTLSPDQFSFLTTVLGSILVIYGIQKYMIKPLFNKLIGEFTTKKGSTKVIPVQRKAKHFRPPRKRRR